jgi:hypothetical protein
MLFNLCKGSFVILSLAKDLDSSVATLPHNDKYPHFFINIEHHMDRITQYRMR